MANAFNDLDSIIESASKLRESIFKNDIIFKSTSKQEDTFYKLLKSLIQQVEYYINSYQTMNHVNNINSFLEKLEEHYKGKEIPFKLKEIDVQLDKSYKEERLDEDGNFAAAADMTVLWPVRIILEFLYRQLNNRVYDKRFNELFKEIENE